MRLRRLGEWCARHFVIVIVLWLAALVALQMLNRSFGGEYEDNFSLSGVQSQQGWTSSRSTIRRPAATAARSCSRTSRSR